MKKIAVILFGPPGAGKGTQANLVAEKHALIHFDSGKTLRSILNDPTNQNNKTIQKERALNEAGVLNSPDWVLKIFKQEASKIAKAGKGIVYSGSPRTMYEAFGDAKSVGLVAHLQSLYKKGNLYFFFLKVSPEEGAKRNKKRRVCEICGTGVLAASNITTCPICAGNMKVRIDDNPEITKKRIQEYNTRTMPILSKIRKTGIKVLVVNGEQPPFKVFADIARKLS
ncbi:MAG: hypothetical protein COU10_00755 [Candidatus Harrisonbacteria bacterium CG10_big_fil_rev_8_21_14_0_10_45_28]|uniref:Adenylate kinase n=1 Tax=Candidatus Harrisonbacteria bacterium CG10_big_fil_rev_8_21_14_0_10_45_28 TaxID=1974586 RepID=A0A2H0UP36_9BACT|nr:MAG: hypothetical protein COU10_00755 [Candidatus Harrisonbacteria bacterium CG10_big_fil_rev_8_21_14_0_10_45_28]